MKKNFMKVVVLVLVIILSGCNYQNRTGSDKISGKPKNIIIFIGDGMGIAHISAGMTVSDQPFSLVKFPYSGFCMTYAADNYITDSAAGGTAIACGIKTNNGMIGMNPDSTIVKSIMEIAHENGLSTGLVSTSAITHATPASFVSHNSSRENYEEIANDFLSGTIDVFIGGGEDHFRSRSDSVDLTLKLHEQGYSIVYTLKDLINDNSLKIAGLLAKEHMPRASEGRQGELKEMTQKAINILSKNKNGFILMVEGSMIDWGSHEQNLDYLVSEMIDLDQAIGVARDFAENAENTLVIVTADHETGGLTLTGGSISEHKVIGTFSGSDHTAVMVPVFSYGPGAEKFSGINNNTFFKDLFLMLLNIND